MRQSTIWASCRGVSFRDQLEGASYSSVGTRTQLAAPCRPTVFPRAASPRVDPLPPVPLPDLPPVGLMAYAIWIIAPCYTTETTLLTRLQPLIAALLVPRITSLVLQISRLNLVSANLRHRLTLERQRDLVHIVDGLHVECPLRTPTLTSH
jgi:hypothetical protein